MFEKLRNLFRGQTTCQNAASFLLDYVEGNLPDKTARRFEAHIGMCPNCELYLAQYRETIRMLQSLPAPEPPAELADLTSTFLKNSLGLDSEAT